MYAEKYRKHIGSAVLTIIVAAITLFSGPASAINIGINGLEGSYNNAEDKQIQFKLDIAINQGKASGELLPIQYTDVIFSLPNATRIKCKVLNDHTVEGCDFLSVKNFSVTGDNTYGYGAGMGRDNGNSYSLGYGYGYGYGTDATTHAFYTLLINSSKLAPGGYGAAATVYAGVAATRAFSSEESTDFTIFTKGSKKMESRDDDDDGESNITGDDDGDENEIDTEANVSDDDLDDIKTGTKDSGSEETEGNNQGKKNK